MNADFIFDLRSSVITRNNLFMSISQEALDLENRSIGINSEPTLAATYKILKEQWNNGNRDRESGLHLIFLTWYGIIEPDHITGFPNNEETRQELIQMLNQVHAYFEPQIYQDAEMLYVVGLIAHMHWFMLEDEIEDARVWEKRSEDYHEHYRALKPNGIEPSIFQNRGAYGDYFAMQAKVEGGY